MSGLQTKQNMLKKIRLALNHGTDIPFPQNEGIQNFFKDITEEKEVAFASQFSSLGGKFAYCNGIAELKQNVLQLLKDRNWRQIFIDSPALKNMFSESISHFDNLASCDASITPCECLVARTGSIVLSSLKGGRSASVYAPVHICIAYSSQILPDVKDALLFLKNQYPSGLPSFITFASGPSRTADIEKTLVTGVHGPKEVFCFLVDTD